MLGENIVKFRKKAKLSQEELAELMKVSRQTISNWELEETSPTAYQVIELSKIFKVSSDELLGMDIKNTVLEKVNGTEKLVKKQIKFTYRIMLQPGEYNVYDSDTNSFKVTGNGLWRMHVEEYDKDSNVVMKDIGLGAGYSYKEAMDSINLVKKKIISQGGTCR